MALNIKNRDVEALAAEVAALTGETKTEAVRRALEERRTRLAFHGTYQPRGASFLRYLEEEVWPVIPGELLGRRMTREDEDELLGYGPDGA